MPLVPYVVERSGREERVFDIYSRLLKDRIVFLQGVIDDASANLIVAQMLFLQFDDPKAKMIYDVAKSLHEGHGVSKGLYDEAVKLLSERGIVEIIGLCGYYTMVSMTLNTFEFELPEGEVSELA